MNGANERAVELFLHDKIKFTEIGIIVREAMNSLQPPEEYGLEDVFEAGRSARQFVSERAAML